MNEWVSIEGVEILVQQVVKAERIMKKKNIDEICGEFHALASKLTEELRAAGRHDEAAVSAYLHDQFYLTCHKLMGTSVPVGTWLSPKPGKI